MVFFLVVIITFLLSFTGGINGVTARGHLRADLIITNFHSPTTVSRATGDYYRQREVGHRLAWTRGRRRMPEVLPPPNTPFEMVINSGAYAGTGQYFVRFQVGTPAQTFMLVVDTGSDLTWMKCKNASLPGGGGSGRMFDPKTSKTFRPIACSSSLCQSTLPFSLSECPAPTNNCLYDYVYADGSTTEGYFATDSATVTLPDKTRLKLRPVTIGCSSNSSGSAFNGADGVLGLGYSPTSFAAVGTARYGGKFSYCLVDHLSPRNATNYLIFGNRVSTDTTPLSYVDLSVKPPLEPFYSIKVQGISLGDKLLSIPTNVWNPNAGGGVILDSGTSLGVLADPAYLAVTTALNKSLAEVPRIDVQPFEFCYNWSSKPTVVVPPLAIHITGLGGNGVVKLTPPLKSYPIDVADGVKCLGFLPTPWPGASTIGNILQQNHLWEFDVKNWKLGFKPSACDQK